jgi:hypothetical protein
MRLVVVFRRWITFPNKELHHENRRPGPDELCDIRRLQQFWLKWQDVRSVQSGVRERADNPEFSTG